MEHKTSMDKPTKSKVLYESHHILPVILNLFHMKKITKWIYVSDRKIILLFGKKSPFNPKQSFSEKNKGDNLNGLK